MTQATIKIERQLTIRVWSCVSCGVEYGVTDEYDKMRRDDLASFYCPNGHRQSYDGLTREQAVRKEQEKTQRALEQARSLQKALDDTMDRLRTEQAASAALKARVGNGVCPDCHRTFKNLALHTRSKHRGVAEAVKVSEEYTVSGADERAKRPELTPDQR